MPLKAAGNEYILCEIVLNKDTTLNNVTFN